ncbi:MAG: hypothetical protein PWQ97_440 [Tepidanaerobacteraceae bacterium]|nr:hypothetical protein [Tepidanaerobacteraceae bacterium]
MIQIITDDVGQIKLDTILLPGIMQSMEIEDGLRIDNQESPNQSGSSKQINGYEDATITLVIRLTTDDESTCYDKAKRLVDIFKSVDRSAKPKIYRIVNKHTQIWGIETVLYKNLRTKESNTDDTMTAEITFEEWKPSITKKEAAATTTSNMSSSTSNGNYIVKSGDTLSDIAARNGVTLTALLNANPQIKNANLIFPGQKISIPKNSLSPAKDDDKITQTLRARIDKMKDVA